MNTCKIIMYHYVRPIKNSVDPKIKGLELEGFQRQIDYFAKKFKFISVEQLIESIYDNKPCPTDSIILTFDDGYIDHYLHVFPILKKKEIQGLFFPPGEPVIEKKMIDVHKIHLILARSKNENEIIKEIFNFIITNKERYHLKDPNDYFTNLAIPTRFDIKETVFIKRCLQRKLPKKVRNELIDLLFKKIVNDEEDFAKNFYLTFEQIEEMRESGMFFGSHGYKHEWLADLNDSDLDEELNKSLKFLRKIKQNIRIMCYPHGNYNERVISKIEKLDYKIGLTTEVGEAELTIKNAFKLKRYDTNDFPQ